MTNRHKDFRQVYKEKGFSANQIECLLEGIAKGLDVSSYENPDFFSLQMNQILYGLEEGLDVSVYAKVDYDWFQMEEIRKGLEKKLDITKYLDSKMDYKKMREIRKGLEHGIDLSEYLDYGADKMRQIRKATCAGFDILEYIYKGYDAEQLDEIRVALEKGISVQEYITPEFRGRAIREIVFGLEEGLNVTIYAKNYYSWRQMQEIRLGLEHRVDISNYSHRLYSDGQMREIRLGLEALIDVEKYRSFMYTAREMENIRKRLETEKATTLEETSNESVSSFNEAKILPDLDVEISEDGMEAVINLSAKFLHWNHMDIIKTLYTRGVRKGIFMNVVELLANDVQPSNKVLIAKGQMPTNGQDGYYEYYFRTDITNEEKVFEQEPVDYKKMDWFEVVKAGDHLASYHGATDGVAGFDVSGKTLPAKRGLELPVLKGCGFTTDANSTQYYAAIGGKVSYSATTLSVVRIHMIDRAVSTQGQLYFDGMVIIREYAGTGACIHASDDIVVEGYVEGATLVSNGNILIRQGVNASNMGRLEAKKRVLGGYFEDATILAGNLLHADYCLNCQIKSQGKVYMTGETGACIGGNCIAQEGIVLKNAGNRVGILTVLSIGIGEQLSAEWGKVQRDISNIQRDLERLKNAVQEMIDKYPPEKRNTMAAFLKISSAMLTKKQQLDELLERQSQMQERMTQIRYAGIQVVQDMFENVTVDFSGIRWTSQGEKNVMIKCFGKKVSVYRR